MNLFKWFENPKCDRCEGTGKFAAPIEPTPDVVEMLETYPDPEMARRAFWLTHKEIECWKCNGTGMLK